MQLIGVRVFSSEKPAKKKRRTRKKVEPTLNIIGEETGSVSEESSGASVIPELPGEPMKIGQFVYTALENLGASGYTFSDSEIDEMCTPEWSQKTFHTKKPFMKKYIKGITDNKGDDGFVRFKSTPFTFGKQQVLISKEWYERQRDLFISWYKSLK